MLRHVFVLLCSVIATPLLAQSLIWDPGAAAGVQNGPGTWDNTTANWFNGSGNVAWPGGTTIAQFGGGAPISSSTVTISGSVFAGGVDFLSFSSVPAGGQAYTITGGTLNFAPNAVISLADTTTTGSIFARINSAVTGNHLTIRKASGTTQQFFGLGTASGSPNMNLTGTLTLAGSNGGLFVSIGSSAVIGSMSNVVVEAGSCFAAGGSGSIYAMPFAVGGFGGAGDYGAIRIDTSNVTISGAITMTADAQIRTNIEITNSVISGGIGESGGSRSFTRVAAFGLGTLTLNAPSTYTGATFLGKSGTVQGGITILDFAGAGAPQTNLLYHNTATVGALTMYGGSISTTGLVLRGRNETENTQTFGDFAVNGTRSALAAVSGVNGSMTLQLGTITRVGSSLLAFSLPQRGAIKTTQAEGFLGPWATVEDAAGRKSWASVQGGAIAGFTGDLRYPTGTSLAAVPGVSGASHLRVDGSSTGNVLAGSGTVDVATLTFADRKNARTLDIPTGQTLRLGAVGGIQAVAGSKGVTVGVAGAAGTLTAGGVPSASGQLILTNFSNESMVINSRIANNGTTGAVSVLLNGSGNVVFPGANAFGGVVTIASGSLEILHADALGGTSSNTLVMQGAALRLAGGITLSESITLGSVGVSADGGIRSLSDGNTILSFVSLQQPSRINSDVGTLTITRPSSPATSDSISGGQNFYLGGNGNIVVLSRLALSSSALTKDGNGTVFLRGNNAYTGPTNVNAGTLHLDFPNAATTTNLLYNTGTGAAAASAGALNMGGGTLLITGHATTATSQNFGALTAALGASNISYVQNGAPSLSTAFTTMSRAAGGLITINLPTAGTVTTTGGANNAIITSGSVPFITIGNNEWGATESGTTRNIVPLSAIANGYTASTASTLGTNADAMVPTTTLGANTAITSLRFNQPQATTVTQSGSRILTIGGILVTPAVGAHPTTISTTTLRTASTSTGYELLLIQNNPDGDLIIDSSIVANGSANSLTKAGPGQLILNGASSYGGTTRIHAGTIALRGSLATTTDLQLGSGSTSGRLVLGSGLASISQTISGLQAMGSGSANRVAGGAPTISTLKIGGPAVVSRFASGLLGGAGTYEDNLALEIDQPGGVLQLGGANTYAGRTTITRGTLEVSLLANAGSASSLGTGAADSVIRLGASSAEGFVNATLRYTGNTVATTDRVVDLANSGAAFFVTAEIESSGLGAVQFTSPFTTSGTNLGAVRMFRLSGTSPGANRIAGLSDGIGSGTSYLEKTGPGSWEVAGAATHTGGTAVREGTLIVSGSISGSIQVGDGFSNTLKAMFAGSGTVGDVEIFGSGFAATSGSSVDPGNGEDVAGILRTNAFSLTNGAHLSLQIGGLTAGGEDRTGYDRIVAAGTVTLTGGDLQLSLLSLPALNFGDTLYLIVNNSGAAIVGALATLNGAPLSSGSFFVDGQEFQLVHNANYAGPGSDQLGNDLALVAIPEPSSEIALLGGIGLLGLLRRRRK